MIQKQESQSLVNAFEFGIRKRLYRDGLGEVYIEQN